MEATITRRAPRIRRSRRLLAASGDERLVRESQCGNSAAFEVIYDRYHAPLLSFCRHMLGSREDAEDALQQTFASAFTALPSNDRPQHLKAWLFTIARNRCISLMRARREEPVDQLDRASTEGLSEEIERRTELRELLDDLQDLPERQRAALVLAEVGDLDHAQVAGVLECETKQVKALVYQGRSTLLGARRAREIPCAEIREEVASASGRELRRTHLRRHIRACEGCAEFEREVRSQRSMFAIVLPVVPSLGLKESVLTAAGVAGGSGIAGGGGGLAAALGAHLGAPVAGKVAAVAIATGGVVGGVAATDPPLVRDALAAIERSTGQVGRALGASAGGAATSRADEKARADSAPRARRSSAAGEARTRGGDSRESPERERRAGGGADRGDGPARGRPSQSRRRGQGSPAPSARAGSGNPPAHVRRRRGGGATGQPRGRATAPARTTSASGTRRAAAPGAARRILSEPRRVIRALPRATRSALRGR